MNGTEVARWTDPGQIPDVAHGIGAMGYVGAASDGWMGGAPDGSTPSVVRAQMDNVVMRQWDGVGALDGSTPAPPPPPPADTGPVVQWASEAADAFDYRAGDGAALGRSFAIEGFEVGVDKLDVEPHTIDGWTYQPWLRETAEGTVVQWSWGGSEQVLLRGVFGVSLEDLASPAPPVEPPVVVPPVVVPPVVVPPVEPEPEPEPPVEPPAPPAAERAQIGGSDGRDRLSLDGLHGADVDLGAGRDRLELGADHSDVTVVLRAGETRGDVVLGFAEGDLLEFHGFGDDAAVEFLSGDRVRVSGEGEREVFRVEGLDGYALTAADYVFV